jgi:DALR anticodon binding domain
MQLDKPVAVIQYPSLVQWLADRLAGAIAAQPESALHHEHATLKTVAALSLDLMPLPLFKPSNHQFGTFSSPLLLQLSTAKHSGEAILQTFVHLSTSKEFSPKLWVSSEGWFYAGFNTDDLITWLQSLVTAKPILSPFEPTRESPEEISKICSDSVLFSLQYAHARCHSLLRLAEQENFLLSDNLEHYLGGCGPSLWQTDGGELYLQTKAEQALLLALMQFPQSLSPQKVIYGHCPPNLVGAETRVLWPLPPAHLYKQAIVWSQLFSDFHRDCRLFGEVQKNAPKLAYARFALVYIVKNVLAFLLEDILKMNAPLEL